MLDLGSRSNSPVNFKGHLKGLKDSSSSKTDLFADRKVYGNVAGYVNNQLQQGDIFETQANALKAKIVFDMPKKAFNHMFGDMGIKDTSKGRDTGLATLSCNGDEVKFTYKNADKDTMEWSLPKADAQEILKRPDAYGAAKGATEEQVAAVDKVKQSLAKGAQKAYDDYMSTFNTLKTGVIKAVLEKIAPTEKETLRRDPAILDKIESLKERREELRNGPRLGNASTGSYLKDWDREGELALVYETLAKGSPEEIQAKKLEWQVFLDELNATLMNRDFTAMDTVITFDIEKKGDDDLSIQFRFVDQNDQFARDRGKMKDYKGDMISRTPVVSSIHIDMIEEPELVVNFSDTDKVEKIQEWLKQSHTCAIAA